MIKAIIVDDEENSRLVITELLKELFPQINILAEADNVKTGIEVIRKFKPNLVFLDIDLPDGTGFNILESIDSKNLKVVFVTGHEEFAIQAIKFSAFDYILKPATTEVISATMNRVLEEKEIEDNELKLKAFYSNQNEKTKDSKKIVLTTLDKIHLIDVKDIIRCEADNNYTLFIISNGKKILVSKTIKTYEELLSPFGFLRIHQSHLINTNFIDEFDKAEGGYLIMSNKDKVPVSQNKKSVLFNYFSSI